MDKIVRVINKHDDKWIAHEAIIEVETYPFTVTITDKKESLTAKQRRLSFLWYNFIGNASGQGMQYERNYYKLNFGVPIMLGDLDFNQFYEESLSHLSYERQLASMEFVPVTSLMKVAQGARYLTEVDQHAAERGIVLPQPEDLYMAALMKDSRA